MARNTIIRAGKSDIRNATSLRRSLDNISCTASQSQLFEPSVPGVEIFPGAKPIENLYKYAHRRYEYDTTGQFSALYLHQQSFLGTGLRIPRDHVLGKKYDSTNVPRATLIEQSSSKTPATTTTASFGNSGKKLNKEASVPTSNRKRKEHHPVRTQIKQLVNARHKTSMASSGRVGGLFVC